LQNNNIWNFATPYSGVSAPGDDLQVDPEFVSTGDLPEFFRLSPNSPCVDSGLNSAVQKDTDLAGLTRIRDGDRDETATVDIGAYEYQAFIVSVMIGGNGSVSKDPDLPAYSYQDQVTLTASPDTGWTFSHWSGDLSGDEATITVTMDQDITATAQFEAIPYTLDVEVEGNGSVTVDPDQATYIYGDVVDLIASPDQGWQFSHWSGDASGDQVSTSITIEGNTTATAHFEAIPYTLDVEVEGNGSVTVDPDQATYTYGDSIDLTANPDPGWVFSSWSGDATGASSTITVTIEGNTSVTATFTQETYTLEVDVEGNGSVTVDPDQATYIYGDVVDLTASPDQGWQFSHWSGDASGDQASISITIERNTTATAHFEAIPYTLEVDVEGNGSVTVDPDQAAYTYGDTVELTALPDLGWSFSGWSGDASGDSATTTVAIEGDTVVTATFTQETYTLDVDVEGNGSVTVDPDQTTYLYGDVVTLTAVPDSEWQFVNWTGDASGTDLIVTMTMTHDCIVTAHFESSAPKLDQLLFLPLIYAD
jgi:uncharacterized repeat protein (TIGR02543 family)